MTSLVELVEDARPVPAPDAGVVADGEVAELAAGLVVVSLFVTLPDESPFFENLSLSKYFQAKNPPVPKTITTAMIITTTSPFTLLPSLRDGVTRWSGSLSSSLAGSSGSGFSAAGLASFSFSSGSSSFTLSSVSSVPVAGSFVSTAFLGSPVLSVAIITLLRIYLPELTY